MTVDTRLLIRGGRILDPGSGIDRVADLLVEDGRIAELGSPAVEGSTGWLDARGLIVSPGFVDIHCHLREPGYEEKETIATGTAAAAAGGFATVCCMPNTLPPLDSRSILDWLKQRTEREAFVNVLPIGCITVGRRGEQLADMAQLADAGAVAFSDDGDPVSSERLMRRAMERSAATGLLLIDHCEDKALSGEGVMNEGELSRNLGLKGIPRSAEEAIVARDLCLSRLTGARIHIAHVSTSGSVDLVRRAKDEGIPVTAEATPHHVTLTEDSVVRGGRHDLSPGLGGGAAPVCDANAKVNPPLRTRHDVCALVEGLRDGVIDAVATDHAPHAPADKSVGFDRAAFGISGLETAFGCLMGLVHQGDLSLRTLVSRLTEGPAKVIGRDAELGALRVGVPANITLFDPNGEWMVDSRRFASKGRNSPWHGVTLRGRVVATVVNGRLAYKDASIPWHLCGNGLVG